MHARPVATMGQLQVPICFCNEGKPRKRNVPVSVITVARECGVEMYSVELWVLDVAATVSCVASIVIGQVGGACSVYRRAGTVSDQGGQTFFLRKFRANRRIFPVMTRLYLMTWIGRDPALRGLSAYYLSRISRVHNYDRTT